METRTLGKNGPELSVIGLGAWAIGGPWIYGWGKVDDQESEMAICRALDEGINWIDTAAAYGFGHSERVIGRAIRGRRNEVFLATKCGLVPDGKGDAYRNSRPESIRKEVEDSLYRLNVEYIDLYQIHWPDPAVPLEDSWGAMVRLKEEALVRYIGVSNYDVDMIRRCEAVHPVQSLQAPYSMLKRGIETEILPYCAKQGIGVLAYSPMQSGLLSGRFDLRKVAPDDWRRKDRWFQEPTLSKALALVEELRPIADGLKRPVGHLAIQWVLKHPAITSAIVGARTEAQVDENVQAAAECSKEVLERTGKILEKHFSAVSM